MRVKILYLLIVTSFSLSAYAQISTQWVSRFNGTSNKSDGGTAIVVDKDGNIYVTGTSFNTGSDDDFLTIKYNSSGVQQWASRYSGNGNGPDKPIALAIDTRGNIIIGGSSTGKAGDLDFTVIKYSPDGDSIWTRIYDLDRRDNQATGMVIDENGNVYMTGYTSTESSSYDYTTVKFNSNGDLVWQRSCNGTGNNSDEASAICIDKIGNIYITGSSIGVGTSLDYLTIKYDSDGDSLWVRRFNGPASGNDQATGIAVDDYASVYVTGYSMNNNNNFDFTTVKYNTNGILQWVVRYNDPVNGNDLANAIAIDKSGDITVSGSCMGQGSNNDYLTVKYNPDGVELWTKSFNGLGNNTDMVTNLALDMYGSIYVTGYSWNGTDNDFTTVKYNSFGEELWVANYNGLGNGNDQPTSLAIDSKGNVIVTGYSIGNATLYDFLTIKYQQSPPGASPALSTPANSSTGIPQAATLSWNPMSNADEYNIQIASDAAFQNITFDSILLGSTQFTLSENHLVNNTKYYWRLNGINAAGAGPWSGIWSFYVLNAPDVPVLLSPRDGGNGNSAEITLEWKEVPTAASYHVQVSRDRTFTTIIVDADAVTSTRYNIKNEVISNNSVYFWRVNATNAGGTVPWSETWCYGVGNVPPPQAPELKAIPNASTGQSVSPVLEWSEVMGAGSYKLLIASDLNFQNVVLDESNILTNSYHIPAGKLNNSTTYYWKVSASNVGGTGNFSLIWTFTTLISGLRMESKTPPKEFKLYKNTPDPFAGSTAIRFDIPVSGNGKEAMLTIYDAAGKEIAKLVQDKLKTGSYVVNWDAGNYQRGIYLYQLKAEGYVLSMRMLLVK